MTARTFFFVVLLAALAAVAAVTFRKRDRMCRYGHPSCDGRPMTCLVRESEELGLYDDTAVTLGEPVQ